MAAVAHRAETSWFRKKKMINLTDGVGGDEQLLHPL